LVARWWQPRRWASLRTWRMGKSSEAVEWMVMVGAPEAEITDWEVVATAKMSVAWALSMLCSAKYCLDWEVLMTGAAQRSGAD
jgi:hypothetical protein